MKYLQVIHRIFLRQFLKALAVENFAEAFEEFWTSIMRSLAGAKEKAG